MPSHEVQMMVADQRRREAEERVMNARKRIEAAERKAKSYKLVADAYDAGVRDARAERR